MAHVGQIPQVKLLIGLMYKDRQVYDSALPILKQKFGQVYDVLEYDFDFTDYYEAETGKGLKKSLLIFKNQIDRDGLAEIKLWTNSVEDKYSENSKRKINIDPGYLTSHNVVLASAKEMPHKISIGKGIFGDVVLEFRSGEFQASRHTFPDFKSDKVRDFLAKNRK
jgi:hypothetical protein